MALADVADHAFGRHGHADDAEQAEQQAEVVAEGVLHPREPEGEGHAEGADDRPGQRAHAAEHHHDRRDGTTRLHVGRRARVHGEEPLRGHPAGDRHDAGRHGERRHLGPVGGDAAGARRDLRLADRHVRPAPAAAHQVPAGVEGDQQEDGAHVVEARLAGCRGPGWRCGCRRTCRACVPTPRPAAWPPRRSRPG